LTPVRAESGPLCGGGQTRSGSLPGHGPVPNRQSGLHPARPDPGLDPLLQRRRLRLARTRVRRRPVSDLHPARAPGGQGGSSRIGVRFQALRYLTRAGTDHRSREDQNSMIPCSDIWCNRNAQDKTLRKSVEHAHVS